MDAGDVRCGWRRAIVDGEVERQLRRMEMGESDRGIKPGGQQPKKGKA